MFLSGIQSIRNRFPLKDSAGMTGIWKYVISSQTTGGCHYCQKMALLITKIVEKQTGRGMARCALIL
ncbi:MAG: hypothetical protein HZA06_03325 [Nitrospirae bacterium]|nr:hypothetical protein [Nitrospirota bacterium]